MKKVNIDEVNKEYDALQKTRSSSNTMDKITAADKIAMQYFKGISQHDQTPCDYFDSLYSYTKGLENAIGSGEKTVFLAVGTDKDAVSLSKKLSEAKAGEAVKVTVKELRALSDGKFKIVRI